MTPLFPEQWLVTHPLFNHLRGDDTSKKAWAVFAETFAPLIYSVPAFLGVTLARADSHARSSLDEVWAEELGTNGVASHPVLFENLHRVATRSGGSFHKLQGFGIEAGCRMVALCGSGPWPVGVSAMLAHESQFPAAYSSILDQAYRDLGESAYFFKIHSTADVEHTSGASSLLTYALENQLVDRATVNNSYRLSAEILRELADRALEAMA
jgi:pyrroloquinoline quinone (PQQ) biosynthesis protein C